MKELDHALGKGKLALGVERVIRREVVGNQEQGHVAHDLGRRRHFDDIAEQQVDLGVSLADFNPPRGQSQSLGLLEQVRVLAAGHFQVVEVGGRRPRARLERGVHGADVVPVAADLDQCPVVDAAVSRGEAQRLDDRAQAGLRGQARHRSHCAVGDVEPHLGSLEDAGGLGPADVMSVKVDRQAHLLTQGSISFWAANGLHRPAMSLMAIRFAPRFSSSGPS